MCAGITVDSGKMAALQVQRARTIDLELEAGQRYKCLTYWHDSVEIVDVVIIHMQVAQIMGIEVSWKESRDLVQAWQLPYVVMVKPDGALPTLAVQFNEVYAVLDAFKPMTKGSI